MSAPESPWRELPILQEAKKLTVRMIGPCAAGLALLEINPSTVPDPTIRALIVFAQGFLFAGPVLMASITSPRELRRRLIERLQKESRTSAYRVGLVRRGTRARSVEDEGIVTFEGGMMVFTGAGTHFRIGRAHVEKIEVIRTGDSPLRFSVLVRNGRNFRSFALEDRSEPADQNGIGPAIDAWMVMAPPDETLELPPSRPHPWRYRPGYFSLLFWLAAYIQVGLYLRGVPPNHESFGPIVVTFLSCVALALASSALQFFYLRARILSQPLSKLMSRPPAPTLVKRELLTSPTAMTDETPRREVSS